MWRVWHRECVAAGRSEATESEATAPTKRRRWIWGALVAVAVIVGLSVFMVLPDGARPTFAYQGPTAPVAPGDEVEVRDTDGTCGPLIVSIRAESVLGFWSQTHSGNIVDGFTSDSHPWWNRGGTSYFTPVPCPLEGASAFELPDDLTGGQIAACDSAGRCARIDVRPD